MWRTITTGLLCWLFVVASSHGQDVFVPRELKATPVTAADKENSPDIPKTPAKKEGVVAKQPVAKAPTVKEPAPKPKPDKVQSAKTEPAKVPTVKEPAPKPQPEKAQTAKTEPAKVPTVKEPAPKPQTEKAQTAKAEPAKVPTVKEPAPKPAAEKVQSAKVEVAKAPTVKEPAPPSEGPNGKEPAANRRSEKVQSAKAEPVKAPAIKEPTKPQLEKVQTAKVEPVKAPALKEPPAKLQTEKIQTVKVEPLKMPPAQEPTVNVQLSSRSMETASTRLADGFDFPVGKPEAEGYYKARGYRPGGHQGEDWDGVRGGDTDLNDPIYCIGDGIVVFARDVHLGWGNVVIIRHAYRENGEVKHIDSLYGHLNSFSVSRGQRVARGQQIGKMGTAHGQYDAHLHLEIRKNLEIGMSRSKFQKNFSNYYDPSQFIASHRHLAGGGASFKVAMNTFTHDSAYHFDDAPNFSARKRSTAQSSAALRKAISSTDH
jgi:murein DD-endopeptidase MepM/ murein hydrolase activator NlpD